MNIVLIGMPGSGKSTAAKKCAERLDLQFIDTDDRIEATYKMPIPKIFKLVGENGFRKLEQQVFRDIIQNENNYVMATGGGLPCFYDNMKLIKRHAVSFYIKMPPDLLADRITNSKRSRPLTNNKSKQEIEEYIEDSLVKRESYYLKADYIYSKSVYDIVAYVEEKMSQADNTNK